MTGLCPPQGLTEMSPQVATILSKDSQLPAENQETYYQALYLFHKHPGLLLPSPFSMASSQTSSFKSSELPKADFQPAVLKDDAIHSNRHSYRCC